MESQTQPELAVFELPNRVEEVKNKRELKAVFEVMANLAGDVDATPDDDGGCGGDGGPMGHESKQIQVGIDGRWHFEQN